LIARRYRDDDQVILKNEFGDCGQKGDPRARPGGVGSCYQLWNDSELDSETVRWSCDFEEWIWRLWPNYFFLKNRDRESGWNSVRLQLDHVIVSLVDWHNKPTTLWNDLVGISLWNSLRLQLEVILDSDRDRMPSKPCLDPWTKWLVST